MLKRKLVHDLRLRCRVIVRLNSGTVKTFACEVRCHGKVYQDRLKRKTGRERRLRFDRRPDVGSDEGYDLLKRAARREDLGHTKLLEPADILIRNDSAGEDQDIL